MGNISLIMVLYAGLIAAVIVLMVITLASAREYKRLRYALKVSAKIIELQEKRIRELEDNA